jgi:hypothetical protein
MVDEDFYKGYVYRCPVDILPSPRIEHRGEIVRELKRAINYVNNKFNVVQ